MSDVLGELKALQKSGASGKGACKARDVIDKLDSEMREQIVDALRDEITWRATTIAAWLRSKGHDISDMSVQRHRNHLKNGECRR